MKDWPVKCQIGCWIKSLTMFPSCCLLHQISNHEWIISQNWPSLLINSRNSCISAIFCNDCNLADRLADIMESKPAQSYQNMAKIYFISPSFARYKAKINKFYQSGLMFNKRVMCVIHGTASSPPPPTSKKWWATFSRCLLDGSFDHPIECFQSSKKEQERSHARKHTLKADLF